MDNESFRAVSIVALKLKGLHAPSVYPFHLYSPIFSRRLDAVRGPYDAAEITA